MAKSSQKFIAQNRAPRVQIEYDVELYGAEKKVQLPFVMGVMSDLSGKSVVDQGSVSDRKFLEIDVDNFDERMKGVAPRAAFNVPNTLTGEGNMAIDLTFEKMSDFEPGAIAARVEALRPLLEARAQLTNLMTYMDGKAGAEGLIEKILADPALLGALAGPAADRNAEQEAALDALRQAHVPKEQPKDSTQGTLDALRAREVPQDVPKDDGSAALDALRQTEVAQTPADTSGAALDALRAADVETSDETHDRAAALASLPSTPLADAPQDDVSDILSGLEKPAEDTPQADDTAAILSGIETAPERVETKDIDATLASLDAPFTEEASDNIDGILSDLDAPEPGEASQAPGDMVGAALAGLEPVESLEAPTTAEVLDAALADLEVPVQEDAPDIDAALGGLQAPEEDQPEDSAEDVLAGIEAIEQPPEMDVQETALSGLEMPEDTDETDDLDALLADLEAPEVVEETPKAEDILAELDAVAEDAPPEDIGAILSDIEAPQSDVGDDEDYLDAMLADLEAPEETAETDTDDILAELDAVAPSEDDAEDVSDILGALDAPEETEETDDLDALLADLEASDVGEDHADDSIQDILSGIEEGSGDEEATTSDLDDILADLEAEEIAPEPESDDLDALLADLSDAAVPAETGDAETDIDALLADLEPQAVGDADAADDLDAMLAELGDASPEEPAEEDDLEAMLADLGAPATPVEEAPEDDLDALLADLDAPAPQDDSDLDALLADLDGDAPAVSSAEAEDDLDALLAGLDAETPPATDGDLDAMLDDLETPNTEPAPTPEPLQETPRTDEPALAFGQMTADRPAPQKLARKRFRMAILGDFTGRAARGAVEIGDALATRKAITLDPDTVEDVIEGFATTLMLPIGKDGAAIEVKLGGLDDLHPDELYENVEIFAALKDLKAQLSHGATAENAAKSLRAWGEAFDRPVAPASTVSAGATMRADHRLSDFQQLICDTSGQLTQASPLDEMLARIVGPHIRKLPDPSVTAMAEAVDTALTGAMRLVLHHPEFQSVEAQWRAVDLIARSIEVDDKLDVVLYDISAEEIAADLTQSDDLSASGFMRLLTEEPMDEEIGLGGYSALMGLYTFEETPPHAHLLGRIARVAAHVDAPFCAAITPGFIETPKKERHPLVATAWDTLRAMPEAGHLALASPRFMLRRPYGAKSEPIYEFDFEEFSQSVGLSGMLWANPVVLVSILMAKSFKEHGPKMELGKIMSMGGMPYHYVNDRYGDQVALPCTERNLTLDKVETVVARGFMPVISVKGRDEIRLGSFQSLAGDELLGPWADAPAPPPSPPEPPEPPETEPDVAEPVAQDPDPGTDTSTDDELDALLASFDLDADDDDTEQSDDDMDAELAALLADL